MTTLSNLRRAAEAVKEEVDLIAERGYHPRYAQKRIAALLAAVDAVERALFDIRYAEPCGMARDKLNELIGGDAE